MVIARRWRSGTSSFVTTDWPSAASVGTRIAPINAATARDHPGKSSQMTAVPPKKASGMPRSKVRKGQRWRLSRPWMSMRAASKKSKMTRAISASTCRCASAICSGTRLPHAKNAPNPSASMGAVTIVRANHLPNKQNAIRKTAMKRSGSCSNQRDCFMRVSNTGRLIPYARDFRNQTGSLPSRRCGRCRD